VGSYRPLGTSPIQRRGGAAPVARWDVEHYKVVEKNLEGLTVDVLYIAIGEILRCYQYWFINVPNVYLTHS
jgi:hypothetical protein